MSGAWELQGMGIGIGYLVAYSLKFSREGKLNELHRDDG